MNKWAWWNPYLPQTLLVSVALAYFGAAMTILFNGIFALFNLIVLIPLLLSVVGAFGIVNLRLWGYIIALISALLPFAIALFVIVSFDSYSFADYLNDAVFGRGIINTIFQVAIVALLVHPMSLGFVKSNFTKKLF